MKTMKKIVCASLKGGTGKSTVTANLGRVFHRKAHQVGLLDVDCIAPTLHKALGLAEAPRWEVNAAEQKIIPYQVDGLSVVTMASHYGENPAVLWDEPTLIRAMRELNTLVSWPQLDYLFLDSPPSSSKFMQELYDCLSDLYGIVLVFQPSDIAVADLVRTIDFIRIKRAPVIGLVSNMAVCISPKGERFWPYLSPRVDIGSVCEDHGIPLLGEVPLTSQQAKVDAEFDKIAGRIESAKPKVLTDDLATRLCKAIARRAVEAVIRRF